MKLLKIFALMALPALLAATCKNGEKSAQTTNDAAPAYPPIEAPDPNLPVYRASHVFNEARADTAQGTVQVKKPPVQHVVPVNEIKAPNTSRRTYLNTGWWFPKMAFQTSDTTIHHNYLGKFLKFRPDQTFDIIKDGKVVDSGHWNFDDDRWIFYLSCHDPYWNNTWKVMEKGFTMILIGQTELNYSGIQIRLDNIKTPPPGM